MAQLFPGNTAIRTCVDKDPCCDGEIVYIRKIQRGLVAHIYISIDAIKFECIAACDADPGGIIGIHYGGAAEGAVIAVARDVTRGLSHAPLVKWPVRACNGDGGHRDHAAELRGVVRGVGGGGGETRSDDNATRGGDGEGKARRRALGAVVVAIGAGGGIGIGARALDQGGEIGLALAEVKGKRIGVRVRPGIGDEEFDARSGRCKAREDQIAADDRGGFDHGEVQQIVSPGVWITVIVGGNAIIVEINAEASVVEYGITLDRVAV